MNDQMEKNKGKYFMGLDIGGTKIWVCITNTSGAIIYKKKVNTTQILSELKDLIYQSLEEAHIPIEEIISIGFGVPGATNSKAGIVIEAPAFQWFNYEFRKKMESLLPTPIYVNNDVNCAASGEKWLGAAQGVDDFVFISLGTGIGSAIVINGEIVNGKHFMAGEIGYMVLSDDLVSNKDIEIGKGEFGLFERKASGTALEKRVFTPEELFVQYKKGEEESTLIIEQYLDYLSAGIVNVITMLDPEKVILGGGVAQSLIDLIPNIETKISRFTPVPVSIEVSELGELSGVLGAVAFARDEFKKNI